MAATPTLVAARIPGLFPKGTSNADGVGKNRAKPVIWAKRKKFEAAAANMKARADAMAKLAMAEDKAGMKEVAKTLGRKGCGSCHRTFRAKKKKNKE